MANTFIGGIVSITLGAIMVANLFIRTVKDANTTGFTTAESTLWDLLSLVGIIGIVYGVLNIFGIL